MQSKLKASATSRRFSRSRIATVICICFAVSQSALAQSGEDALMKGFANPPASAQPRVWWHWMNGNISKEGIKLDLSGCIGPESPASRTSTLRWIRRRSSTNAWPT